MTIWRHWMVGQLDASIAAALLLAIALLARHRLPPQIRSAMLLVALVRLALPPWIRSPWSEALVDVPPLDDSRSMVALALQFDVAMYAFAATTAVTVFLLGRLGWQAWSAEARWAASTSAAPLWLERRMHSLGLPGIEVRISDAEEGPLAAGLRRRLIVLPRPVLELEPAALDAVLAHEAAHHARHDLVWILAASALKAIAWFNPLAHVIARAIVATREDGSDDWAVTRTSNDPFTYANALLQSARLVASPLPAVAAGAHPMGRRLQRLLDHRASREGRLGVAGIALILVAAAAAIPGAHMPSLSDDTRRIVIIR